MGYSPLAYRTSIAYARWLHVPITYARVLHAPIAYAKVLNPHSLRPKLRKSFKSAIGVFKNEDTKPKASTKPHYYGRRRMRKRMQRGPKVRQG